jgi:arylsulfatase A-like enzyme
VKRLGGDRRTFLKGACALSLSACAGVPPGAVTRTPNILFILADDLGYADLSIYGQTDYQTPELDRLARQGMRLTQAYANSAVCSASRVALITGRYQYRLRGGLEEPIGAGPRNVGLPPSHPTLASLLRQRGYRTALVGKWHMGDLPDFGPLKSGYEMFFGNYGGALDYFTHKFGVGADKPADLFEGEVPVHKTGYYTDLLADRAVDYIRAHDKSAPFLLSLHFTAPHWPWEGPGDEAISREIKSIFHYDGGSLAVYARMVTALDSAVGRVLRALEDRGLARDTIVIFTSDNGGERFSKTWPFSGQKTELLEGGIRVPCIIRWPAAIAAGQTNTQVTMHMDWLPTLLACAGGEPDPAYPSDGENLLPLMVGEVRPHPRTLYWRYKSNTQRAVRDGDWKYFRISGNDFLFNLASDVRERANLAQKNPEVLARLRQQWEAWDATMLPVTDDVGTHAVSGRVQADHYKSEK